MGNIQRVTHKEALFDFDITKPITSKHIRIDMVDGSCFGKKWDLNARECPQCADKDICGIIFREEVNAKAAKIQKESGVIFLDESRMDTITFDSVFSKVEYGVTTTVELYNEVKNQGNTSDKVAIVNWIKRMVKGNPNIYIKNRIVWKR